MSVSSTCSQGGGTPGSITHQLSVEDYLRLLKEAQESNQSSARVSLAGSRRDSPRSSPKSPPNSPVQGTPLNLEWQSYYMNSETKDVIWRFKPIFTTYRCLNFRIQISSTTGAAAPTSCRQRIGVSVRRNETCWVSDTLGSVTTAFSLVRGCAHYF